jgi:hypothetical protein
MNFKRSLKYIRGYVINLADHLAEGKFWAFKEITDMPSLTVVLFPKYNIGVS